MENPNALLYQAPAELPSPFPGLLLRGGALLIDLFLVYTVCKLLEPALQPLYYAAGLAGYHLGLLLFLLYFVLCEGPPGRGATLGKMVFNLRAVSRDFKPLTCVQAGARTARFAFFAFQLQAGLGLAAAIAPAPYAELRAGFWPGLGATQQLWLNLQSPLLLPLWYQLIIVSFAFSAADAVYLSLHPHKRGLHDLLAGTYVVRDAAEARAAEQAAALAAGHERPLYPLFAAAAFLIPLLLGETFVWKNLDAAQLRRDAGFQREFRRRFTIAGAFAVAGYYDLLALPDNRMAPAVHAEAVFQQLAEGRVRALERPQSGAAQGDARPTSFSVYSAHDLTRLQVFSAVYYRGGAWPASDTATLAGLQTKIGEHCLELRRRGEYPFLDENGRVAELPTSAIVLLQAVDTYNFFLVKHWRSDWISTSVLKLEFVDQ